MRTGLSKKLLGILVILSVLLGTTGSILPSGTAYADSDHLMVFFTVNPNPAIPGEPAYFDAKGSYANLLGRGIVKYEWDFGDSTSATGIISTHTYTQKGTFNVTLKVTDNVGDSNQLTLPIVCEPRHSPGADPYGPYAIYWSENLHLDGSHSTDQDEVYGDSIANYEWDINGDGDFSDAVGEEVVIPWGEYKEDKFVTPEQYPADPHTGFPNIPLSLRVTDSTGRTGITTTTLTIYDNVAVAVPTWGPQPEVPVMPDGTATVHLDGSASYSGEPRYPVKYWTWTVAGSTQSVSGEVTDMKVDLKPLPASFPYESITKTLQLEVTSDASVATASFQVTFGQLPSQPPDIEFNVGREGVFIEQGEGFAVSAGGTTDPDGDWIKSFGWDLNNDGVNDIIWNRADTNGDGVVDGDDEGPNLNLSMSWAEMAACDLQGTGEHRIRLTVNDSTNVSASDTVRLTVLDKALLARAEAVPGAGSPETSFTFDGSQSRHLFPGQSIANWQWDFNNDGAFETSGQTVAHTFGSFGVFPVTLKITDLLGHSNTATIQVSIIYGNTPPVPDAGGPYTIAPGVGITLNGSNSFDPDESYGDFITSYQWDINGDGNFDDASGANPTLTYAQIMALGTGIRYRFSLKVTDSFGAAGTASTALNIEFANLPPTADAGGPYYTTVDNSGVPMPINLDGSQSRDPNALPDYIASYDWDTDGDGLYGTDDEPDDYTGMIVEYVNPNWQVGMTYPVSLKVTDSYSAVSEADQSIIIVLDIVPPNVAVERPSDGEFLHGTSVVRFLVSQPQGKPVVISMFLNDAAIPFVGSNTVSTPSDGSWVSEERTIDTTSYPDARDSYRLKVVAALQEDSGMSSQALSSPFTIDNTPPIITAPANITVEQTSPAGATISSLGTPNVSDTIDTNPAITNNAPAIFPPGITTVVWTARDAAGNTAQAIQTVTVWDNTPPTITAPANITVEQNNPDGATIDSLSTPTVSDVADPNPIITNDAPPIIPPGVTTVTWTATDASGNMATATQEVTVLDTTPPTITAPADITVEQNAPGGAIIASLGTPTVSDAADSNPLVTNDAPAVFPLGSTTVTWTAMDASGNSASAPQTVTVTPKINEYTLDITVTGSGTVNRDNDGPYYDGDIVQLTAVPDAGWSFASWSGELTGNNNPVTITMDGNKTVTATFAPDTLLMKSFNIDKMVIDFSRQDDRDAIFMKADFALPDGVTFAPANDDVNIDIDGFAINVPAGSFKAFGKGSKIYTYSTAVRDKPGFSVTLNFKKGELKLVVHKANLDIIDNSDGVNVTFSINSITGAQSINMFVERLTYSYIRGTGAADGFNVDKMVIDFSRQDDRDAILMNADFALPDGVTFNPASDDVNIDIDGFAINVPAGSFKALGKGSKTFTYSTAVRDKPGFSVTLNFKKGELNLVVHKANLDIIDNSDGVDVTFSIGSSVGEQTVNMFIDKLTYDKRR